MAIGFIGLGNIGKPMAARLLRLKEEVWLYDLAAQPLQELAEQGARPAASPKDLAAACHYVGLCVRGDADVDALLDGPDGLLANLGPGAIVAVHSTVTRQGVLRWAQASLDRGIHLIDAPISGGAASAEAGTLAYMVGGEREVVERCRRYFETSARTVVHAGPVGSGIALKLCNNLMTYAAFAAIDEAVALARRGGLDTALLLEIGRANGVVTPQMEAFLGGRDKLQAQGKEALLRGFAPMVALARKDLAAALACARELGVHLPLTERVDEVVESAFLNGR
jgi:3-hydroxyisobutyrate dehydrogenase